MQTVIRLMLASRYSMWMGWGDDLAFFYNDAYSPTLGLKHPWALGQPAREVWSEIWNDIGPRIRTVLHTGRATYDEALLLILERSGFPEETYHTFSYSPITDDVGQICGLLCVVTEETERVITERRMALLRELGSKLAVTNTQPEVIAAFEPCVAAYDKDLPFTLTYLFDLEHPALMRLSSVTGVPAGHRAAPPTIDITAAHSNWPIDAMMSQSGPAVIDDLASRFGEGGLPTGAWDIPPQQAVVMPLKQRGEERAAGFIVAAVNPHRRLSKSYLGFFELLAGQFSAALSNAQAHEAERRRAEALAEIDRAKTAFFSNVSHEFRTPLTLLLGPLEEAIAGDLNSSQQERLQAAHRNALRLLKLVNSLLDFSRIEAGRINAAYMETDLAAFTAELAAVFRSAIEKAGMRLVIDCQPLSAPAYVDRDMWEKIILNLLSNAFKFTFEGEIAVTLRSVGDAAEVKISDTGIGIPAEELPHIFERFHRVEGARGRTHEGTGIGLALVQELVKLHAGSLRVESTVGKGTTFIISIPLGTRHLPQTQIRNSARTDPQSSQREAFVEEAIRWLPFAADETQGVANGTAAAPTILVADDNADMRDYVRRLLSPAYRVVTAANGEEALEAALAAPPDLVLSDIMMPSVDGLQLLHKLRANPATLTVPVILLSARAGEEARTEGMSAGADDYLVKPFSARELLARVGAHLKLSHARKEAEGRASVILESIRDGFVAVDSQWRYTYVNAAAERMNGLTRDEHIGRTIWEIFPAVLGTNLETKLRYAISAREPVEYEYLHLPWGRWFAGTAYPTSEGGLAIYFRDITEEKKAAGLLRESETRLQLAIDSAALGTWEFNPADGFITVSARVREIFGASEASAPLDDWFARLHPEDRATVENQFDAALSAKNAYDAEFRVIHADRKLRWVRVTGRVLGDGSAARMIGLVEDISGRKNAEEALRESEERFRTMAEALPQLVWTCQPNGDCDYLSAQWVAYTGIPEKEQLGLRWLDLVMHPEDRAPTYEAWMSAVRSEAPYDLEYRLRRFDGSYRWFKTRGTPVRNAAGEILRWFGTCTDIDDQIRVEKELRRANQDLEQFAYSASHDLQEPLRMVTIYSQMLHKRYENKLDDKADEYIGYVTRGAKQMEVLLTDLLAYTHAASVDDTKQVEVVSSEAVMADVQTSLEAAIRESGAVIITGKLPALRIQRVHLMQLLQNLLGNALKYRSEKTPEIHVYAERQGAYWLFSIRDNGIGISSKHKDLVFGIFKRLHGQKYEGTGIGLAICQRIVERYGGRIWVESETGAGSTFRFTLPAYVDAL
ncbi:MAG: PAS domain S-box protein [Acidobacteriaceae bacterium]|nr:PAS domain S-box protein [Acidobacteriaceae bacterium]